MTLQGLRIEVNVRLVCVNESHHGVDDSFDSDLPGADPGVGGGGGGGRDPPALDHQFLFFNKLFNYSKKK